jgi:AcrR family transcriptional regulator
MILSTKRQKKTLKPVNYRQKILDAAVKVFAKKGYQNTTI